MMAPGRQTDQRVLHCPERETDRQTEEREASRRDRERKGRESGRQRERECEANRPSVIKREGETQPFP